MAEAAIDVIDIGPYLAGDPAGTRRVVGAVRAACERIGFLVIAGHGVPDALVRRVFDVSTGFFDLPLAEKLAVRSAGEHMLAKLERREARAAV
jgi:isopenicillin N synthase-like dioxygenase